MKPGAWISLLLKDDDAELLPMSFMTGAEIHSWSRDMLQVVADYFEKILRCENQHRHSIRAMKPGAEVRLMLWNLAQDFALCYEMHRGSLCVMKP